MKKIIALVLALVMVLSLSTVAFAGNTKVSPIKAAVANVTAVLLQKPAFYLAKALSSYADDAIVTLPKYLPNAYKALEANLFAIDYAVQTGALLAKANLKINSALADVIGLDTLVSMLNGSYKLVDTAAKAVKDFAGDLKNKTIGNIFGETENLFDDISVDPSSSFKSEDIKERIAYYYDQLNDKTLEKAITSDAYLPNFSCLVKYTMLYVSDILSNPEYFAPMDNTSNEVGGKSAVAEFIYWKLLTDQD